MERRRMSKAGLLAGRQMSKAGLLAASLFLTGCQGSVPAPVLPVASPAPNELRVAVANLPATTDPALTQVYEGAVARAAFESLLKPRADLSDVLPAAAERYDVSADGLTYTFHLRAKARWSDGAAVRAEDFATAWRRILDPRANSPWGDLLASRVKKASQYATLDPVQDDARIPAFLAGVGLRAVDDLTFVVDLEKPSPDFRWIAAVPALAPSRAGPPGSGDAGGARISNGPFQVLSASAQQVVLTANAHYWAGRPHLGRIVLTQLAASDETAPFRRGQEDLTRLNGGSAAAVERDPGLAARLLKVARLEQTWIQFNVHEAPFDNPHVRLAVARSIDREALVRQLLSGMGIPSVGLIPTGLPDSRPALVAQRFDVAGARSELNSAGFTPGSLPALRLLVRDLPTDRQLAEFVAAQVRDHLGVDIVLEVKPSKEVSRRLANGRFQLQGPSGWVADYADERDWMDLFLTEHFSQSSRYSNAAYDHLVEQGDRESDVARRRQDYLQAQQLLAEEAPVAFLFQAQTWSLQQPYVSGLKPSPLDAWPGDAFAAEIIIGKH